MAGIVLSGRSKIDTFVLFTTAPRENVGGCWMDILCHSRRETDIMSCVNCEVKGMKKY